MVIRCLRRSLSLARNASVSSPADPVRGVYVGRAVGGCSTFQTHPRGIQDVAGGITAAPRSLLLVWWMAWPSFEDQPSLCVLETELWGGKLRPVGSFEDFVQEATC